MAKKILKAFDHAYNNAYFFSFYMHYQKDETKNSCYQKSWDAQ